MRSPAKLREENAKLVLRDVALQATIDDLGVRLSDSDRAAREITTALRAQLADAEREHASDEEVSQQWHTRLRDALAWSGPLDMARMIEGVAAIRRKRDEARALLKEAAGYVFHAHGCVPRDPWTVNSLGVCERCRLNAALTHTEAPHV